MSSDKDAPEDATFVEDEGEQANRGLLRRVGRRVAAIAPKRERILERSSKARDLAERALDSTRRLAERIPVQEGAEAALRKLTDPRAVALMQTGLTALGNTGLELSFRREPHAKLLFDFAEWCGEEVGREKVMGLIMQDALSPKGAFNQLAGPLLSLGASGDPLGAFAAMPRTRDTRRQLHSAHHGMMRTLCSMAVMATGAPPPPRHATPPTLAAHFKATGVPPQFEVIADVAMGLKPSKDVHKLQGEGSQSAQTSTATTTAISKVREFLPTIGLHPTHRFLLGPYLVFLQAYLTRNMVDAMPNFMDKIREELDEES